MRTVRFLGVFIALQAIGLTTQAAPREITVLLQRDGDDVSQRLAQRLLQSREVQFWQTTPENMATLRKNLGAVPYWPETDPENTPAKLWVRAKEQFAAARQAAKRSPQEAAAAYERGWAIAETISPAEFARRPQLRGIFLREYPAVLARLNVNDPRINTLLSELVIFDNFEDYLGSDPLIAQRYTKIRESLRGAALVCVEIQTPTALHLAVEIAVDGGKFTAWAADKKICLPVGRHEIVFKSQRYGFVHEVLVAAGATPKPVIFRPQEEAELQLSPRGFSMRPGKAPISNGSARLVTQTVGAAAAWVIEQGDKNKVQLTVVNPAEGLYGTTSIDAPAGAAIDEAILLSAARTARTRVFPQQLSGYQPKQMSPSDFVFVHYEGEWHQPAPPFYKQWWFWTAAGAVVAGATTAIILTTRDTGVRTVNVKTSLDASP